MLARASRWWKAEGEYNNYQEMKFQEVIGQGEAKQRLVKLVEEGRVPHAMLFTGPKGCGKMAMAMAFASYLLCANRHDGDSCGTCQQ